eukprot:2641325-Alexandrium_andersonii.AAC.1
MRRDFADLRRAMVNHVLRSGLPAAAAASSWDGLCPAAAVIRGDFGTTPVAAFASSHPDRDRSSAPAGRAAASPQRPGRD